MTQRPLIILNKFNGKSLPEFPTFPHTGDEIYGNTAKSQAKINSIEIFLCGFAAKNVSGNFRNHLKFNRFAKNAFNNSSQNRDLRR